MGVVAPIPPLPEGLPLWVYWVMLAVYSLMLAFAIFVLVVGHDRKSK